MTSQSHPSAVLFLLITIPFLSRADISDGMMEKRILDRMLAKEYYDPHMRPNGTSDGATVVKLQMYIIDLYAVDDNKMEFTATMYLRQKWNDSRLVFDDNDGKLPNITLGTVERIWKPDLFFINEREGDIHTVTSPNRFARISSTGEVLYSIKITETFYCPMNFVYYPLDTQICSMAIESYSHSSKSLHLEWSEKYTVEISDEVNIPRFSVKNVETRERNIKAFSGEYIRLCVDVTLTRKVMSYVRNIYIPLCSMIVLSWITFWLDSRLMYARLALLLVLLSLTYFMVFSITDSTPPVSYTKATDVWTGICVTFIFASLVEFLVVTILQKNEEDHEQEAESVSMETGMLQEDTSGKPDGKKDPPKTSKINIRLFQRYLKKYPSRSQRCDVASRILFPVLFAFFNLVYWCAYTCGQSVEPASM